MRVVSQNGAIDVPYELNAIHRSELRILMNMAGDTGRGSVLATYSTEAKAIKAMKMLHEEWLDFGKSGLFKFPEDEDVEVDDE